MNRAFHLVGSVGACVAREAEKDVGSEDAGAGGGNGGVGRDGGGGGGGFVLGGFAEGAMVVARFDDQRCVGRPSVTPPLLP